MQRMRMTVIRHGPIGRRESLRQQLPPIHATFALRRLRRREAVRTGFHQVQHAHECAAARRHYECPSESKFRTGSYSSSR